MTDGVIFRGLPEHLLVTELSVDVQPGQFLLEPAGEDSWGVYRYEGTSMAKQRGMVVVAAPGYTFVRSEHGTWVPHPVE